MSESTNPLINKEVIDLLNYRIEQEESSSRLYQAMSLYLNDKGYINAAAAWMKDSNDEMTHAGWAKEYLLDMGITPKTPMLKEQPLTFEGFPDIIRKTYEHEVTVTKQCNFLAGYALKNNDHLLHQLAMKYMQEQQEEMGKVQTYMDKLETFGEDKVALRLFDLEFKD